MDVPRELMKESQQPLSPTNKEFSVFNGQSGQLVRTRRFFAIEATVAMLIYAALTM
jgi:hypothetical protein